MACNRWKSPYTKRYRSCLNFHLPSFLIIYKLYSVINHLRRLHRSRVLTAHRAPHSQETSHGSVSLFAMA